MRGKWIIAVLLLLNVTTVFAVDVTTTVKYIVLNDLAFTITYPAQTSQMWFEPASQTVEKNATNQTSTVPIITYTNTGNVAEYYDVKIDATVATITLKCSSMNAGWQSACDCEGATGSPMSITRCCNITTGSSRVNVSSTAIGGTQTMWCWAKFVSSPAGTTTKTMTSTSGAS